MMSSNVPLILIVDDENFSRRILRMLLQKDGCRVEEAKNGFEGLSAFKHLNPDIIFLDAMMPELNGFETCMQLRKLPGGEHVPILIITGLDDETSVNRAFEAGATDYIIKPINVTVVRQRVRYLVHSLQAEKALRDSEERYRSLFEATFEGIAINDQGIILSVNHAFAEMFGYANSDIIGKHVANFVINEYQDLVKANHLSEEERPYEFTAVRKDGTPFYVEARSKPYTYQSKLVRVTAFRDITNRRKAEDMVVASQKLASLGTLVAGLAHEINSPLQVITGVSRRLLKRLQKGDIEPDYLHNKLDLIYRNGWRCAEIVRALHLYSHTSTIQFQANDLNTIIQDALLMVENQLKSWSNITIMTDLSPELPVLHCDRNQIIQVLVNLLTNSRDAMSTGGKIIICTDYDPQSHKLSLRIRDTGEGIPEAVQSKIFDPFFTTKSIGQGTGLGLSITAGIIRAHGGSIEVDSSSGQGTSFIVHLPIDRPTANKLLLDRGTGRFDEADSFIAINSQKITLLLR